MVQWVPFGRPLACAVLAGLASGALVLGIGGRVLMRLLALATGRATGFSLGGSFEVVAAGALYGALGGALLLLVPARLRGWRAPLHAAALFTVVALSSDAARGAASSVATPARLAALLAFGVLLLGYSMLLTRMAAGLRAEPGTTGDG